MTKPPSQRLGAIVIHLPTATQAKCGLFLDLAEKFGCETNAEAVAKLKEAWRSTGLRGRLDIDREADFASIYAASGVVVDVVMLINRLALPQHQADLTEQDIALVRGAIAAHRRPQRAAWTVGDLFSVALRDGSLAFGQVLGPHPSCALLAHRHASTGAEKEIDLDHVLSSGLVAILHVSRENLDDGRWPILGQRSVIADPFSGPCGNPSKVGGRSWNGLDTLASAWHGLTTWNKYHRADFLDGFLMPSVRRRANAILVPK